VLAFFATHRCSPLCRSLGLRPFLLSPAEQAAQARLYAAERSAGIDNDDDDDQDDAAAECQDCGPPTEAQLRSHGQLHAMSALLGLNASGPAGGRFAGEFDAFEGVWRDAGLALPDRPGPPGARKRP
jgi:hypothetical protein